ncbi:DUF4385 family protein [Haloglomus litoreum]|uniref:DUF4385 family protein n=1 Tax=Haloglomus litoreum TaxID=3034026 RepID=UPI0023E88E3F|nr:DUF4385 family protein [Haloglomus sp. DT116]
MSDDGPEYDTDFREHPTEYRVGRGEEGAFKVEPYKSELLPLWGIKTVAEAEEGAAAIRERFEQYREDDEFPGMDMARKYLQMGWTRAMRYAKYPGGQKYETTDEGERVEREPQQWYDEEKREIALVYKAALDEVRKDEVYQRRKAEWTEEYG